MAQDKKLDIETFLFSAVHDMKNSVGVLAGSIEGLIREDSARYEQLGQMFYEVRRINANLNHLLTLYKLGLAAYPFEAVDVHLHSLVEEVIQQNAPLLASRRIEADFSVDDELIWPVDEYLVSSVIAHALNNAIKYTRDRVSVLVAEQDGMVQIRVEDNGEGYPDFMLNTTPEEMCTGDRYFGGTGLGIYFADAVAKLHRNLGRAGRVHLENGGQYGGGCFVLTLP